LSGSAVFRIDVEIVHFRSFFDIYCNG
jgi:hypothetical protein